MKIYGLIGKSGTGKSFQAIGLCERDHIEGIIDDGLFIMNGTVLAGKSAKRQATKVGAIKTALYSEDGHRNEVAAKIAEQSPRTLLVIGTSDRMVDQITERLGLHAADERVYIESLTTADERKIANYRRNELGQHIIPAPTLEVKRDFSGYFLHPLKVLKDIRDGRAAATERSVVRPTFSYFGNYSISDGALKDIVRAAARNIPAIAGVPSVFIRKRPDGIIIDTGVLVRAGNPIIGAARVFQAAVKESIETMTAMNVIGADVEIEDLVWPSPATPKTGSAAVMADGGGI
ncbi:MAG: Asp23/Gls24 family envelope stress response protein [Clostridiales Family XIII bacterium]|jgi:uncharacterized alkaline shock family protein YloU|nr:Asp23/Gls24 family envelope stress response protein [Clostridiales Family XIII bacterium]